jgi:hypothetical protein
MQDAPLMALRVPVVGAYLHAADGILARVFSDFVTAMAPVVVVSVSSVYYVCAATEAHHQIKEHGEQ